MTDPTVPLPPDPRMSWPVVTDVGFPAGLVCCHCGRPIDVGQPFAEHTTRIYANGDSGTHFACVYCPCDDVLEAAP